MKKYCTLGLALALCCAFFVGCGCSNSAVSTTAPTTIMPPTRETTTPATTPTTEATVMPTTEVPTNPTDMYGENSETAGENGVVEDSPSTDATDDTTAKSRSGNAMHPMNPMG